MLTVSVKKIFEEFVYIRLCKTSEFTGGAKKLLQKYCLKNIIKSILKHVTIQLCRLQVLSFYRRSLKMYKTMTLEVEPIQNAGIQFELSWQRSTRQCYTPNLRALGLEVQTRRVFKRFILVAIATSILHGNKFFEKLWQTFMQGIFLLGFINIDLVVQEKMLRFKVKG